MLSSTCIPPPDKAPRIVRAKQLAEWLGITENTVFSWVRKGILPAPRELGPRTKLFSVEAVRAALVKIENEETVTIPLVAHTRGDN